jgi:GNAT superfamily N-acetyltransferase
LGVTPNPPTQIEKEHDLESFCSGRPALDEWLKSTALQARYSGTAATFVVTNFNGQVVGYYSLAMGSINQSDATERVKKGTGSHKIPVILLARLAIDEGHQGIGLGRALLKDAVVRAVNISKDAGVRAILTHPIDEKASAFYKRFGFEESPIDTYQVMILLKDVRKTLGIG